jgi:excisionase family DNA binding protein
MERSTMTVEEAAVVLGISRTTAYECVRRGELRAVRLGRRLVVPRLVVDQLLAGEQVPASPSLVES